MSWQLLVAAIVFLSGMATRLQAGPPVEVRLLDGTTQQGELLALSPENLKLRSDDGEVEIPIEQLMRVALPETNASPSPQEVHLVDHSLLRVNSLSSDGTTVTLESPTLGTLSVPVRQIADVQLAPQDPMIQGNWDELRSRGARDDLLAFRKGDVLDYAAGSVGKVTDKAVTMRVGERELSAPIERVFGIIYAARNASPSKNGIAVKTDTGDLLQVQSVDYDGEDVQVQMAALGEQTLPLEHLKFLDYGNGRIRSLADLSCDASASAPPGDGPAPVWYYSLNSPAGTGGRDPLLVGRQKFQQGVWAHSGAVLRYRLNREYVEFRATVGFDWTHVTQMPRFEPKVRLVIEGDGRELYSQEFDWDDAPLPISVDLKDVRELTVRVESLGRNAGILEHLALGDAQVIK